MSESAEVRRGRDVHLNLLILANRGLGAVEEICSATAQLSHPQYAALWTLCLREGAGDPSDEGVAQSAIADGQITRAADVSRLVDRMVRAGLVERRPNPADRRGVLIRATVDGRRRFDAATEALQAFHAHQFDRLDAAELAQLDRLLAVLVHDPST